uniref:C-type lectin domain-containing protein n=1 Tax=Sander lucioperca TaxID=283035 RepID=A0A8C9YQF9_SANLU
ERDDLKRKLNNLGKYDDEFRNQSLDQEASKSNNGQIFVNFVFHLGWEYFSGSFYYISSTKKTWKQSRDDCLQKGADLVIINSKEEQVRNFTRKSQKIMWIGLTDSETEGTWKWVDGTPLTKSSWDSGEPNGGENENCVEMKKFELENSWNDLSCSTRLNWICEMKDRP